MTDIVPQQLVTTAFIDMIRAAVDPPVGDHSVPPGAAGFYAVVYQLPSGESTDGPPLTEPDADWALMFQVTSAGTRRDQAQWLGDKVRNVVLSRNPDGSFAFGLPAIPGWKVADRVSSSASSGVQVEGTPPNRSFSVPDRYTLHVTPA